jgi:hypothetical protein
MVFPQNREGGQRRGGTPIGAAPREPGFSGPPDAYDPAAIARDPDSYYARSLPNRVWQQAPARPGQPRPEALSMEGEPFRFALANGKKPAHLVVRGKPHCP